MHLLSRQQHSLAGLQRLLVAGRITQRCHCCLPTLQPPFSQQHQCVAAAAAGQAVASWPHPQSSSSVLLHTPSRSVSRLHTTRYTAARSTANATGETDSIAAVKRLVSTGLLFICSSYLPLFTAYCQPLTSTQRQQHCRPTVSLCLQYDAAAERLGQALQLADVAGTKARLAALQNDASSESIWDDPAKAQALVTEISTLKDELAQVEG